MRQLEKLAQSVSGELCDWADAEFAEWPVDNIDIHEAHLEFIGNHRRVREFASFRVENGRVTVWRKNEQQQSPTLTARTRFYARMIQGCLPLLPEPKSFAVQIHIGDKCVHRGKNVPCFTFEKTRDLKTVLVPDFEFERDGYFEAAFPFRDTTDYLEKYTKAIFCGATSGQQITMQVARHFSTQRLDAYRYFRGNKNVVFELPVLVQCAGGDVISYLKTFGIGDGRTKSWSEQFKYKFLISMDGNGATCSRIAISLLSNSVLVKYDSDHRLFYFRGLERGRHYLAAASHGDVEKIVEMEFGSPGHYKAVSADGRSFARKFLNRSAIMTYLARIIFLYQEKCGLSIDAIDAELGPSEEV